MSMSTSIFQEVFDELQEVLPDKWKKVIFFAAYTSGSYSMKFYCDCGDGQYVDCFGIPEIEKAQLTKLFIRIDKILSAERKELEGADRWTVFTMNVDAKGLMKTEFDYVDLSENMIAYEQEWKKKYL